MVTWRTGLWGLHFKLSRCDRKISTHAAVEPSKGRLLLCFCLELMIVHRLRLWPHQLNCVHACVRLLFLLWKFSLDKNFAEPSYLCIAEIFGGINFRQCGKGHHILCVIINTGQKIHVIKISPMRADGEIGKNFLLAKISAYMVFEGRYYLGCGFYSNKYGRWGRCHLLRDPTN